MATEIQLCSGLPNVYSYTQPVLSGFRYKQDREVKEERCELFHGAVILNLYSDCDRGCSDDELLRRYEMRLKRFKQRFGGKNAASSIGRPSLRKASNDKAAEWWARNWLNVKLGLPTSSCIEYQAGKQESKESRLARRAEREVRQRAAAAARERARFKLKPKLEREMEIKKNRDKRSGVEFECGRDVAVGAISATAVSLAAFGIYRLCTKATVTVSEVDKLLAKINGFVDAIKVQLGNALWIVPVSMLFYYVLTKTKIASPVFGVLILSVAAKVLGPAVWDAIKEFFPNFDSGSCEIEHQAGLSTAASLMTTLMAFSMLGKGFKNFPVGELMKRISILPRAAEGWEVFFEWVLSAFEKSVNYFLDMFGKDRVSLFAKTDVALKAWFEEVDATQCAHNTASAELGVEEINKLVRLVVRGNDFKLVYRGTPLERSVNRYATTAADLLVPHLGSINARNNFRVEPIACMFYGAPGIGKTLMAVPLCLSVLIASGVAKPGSTCEDMLANIWQKGNSEYWNSYTGQACMVMDDIFQQKADVSDKENDYMTLIRAISSWSFPLNFADLNSKGKIFFGSKFIFGTTNVKSIWSECAKVIHEPGAVARRLRFAYKLEVVPEYLTAEGRLDHTKFQEALTRADGQEGWSNFPWHIWQVRKHDFITGKTEEGSQSLEIVIKEMASLLKARLESHGSDVDRLKRFAESLMKAEHTTPTDVELQGSREIEIEDDSENTFWKPEYGRYKEGGPTWWDKIWSSTSKSLPTGTARDDEDGISATESLRRYLFRNKEINDWVRERTRLARYVHCFLKSIGGVTVALFLLKGTLSILGAIKNFLCGAAGAFAHHVLGVPRKPKDKGVKEQSNRKLTNGGVVTKPAEFQARSNFVSDNVYNNGYKLIVRTPGSSDVIMGQVQFLTGTLAVQPHHFTTYIERDWSPSERKSAECVLRSAANAKHDVTMSVEHYLSLKRVKLEDSDLEFLDFQDLRAHRNVVGSYVRESDVKYLGGSHMAMHLCEVDNGSVMTPDNKRVVHTCPRVVLGKGLPLPSGRALTRYVAYDVDSERGDCGAPLCLVDNSSYQGRTCAGFHVAGSTSAKRGYATILTQEMINDAMRQLQTVFDGFEDDLKARGVRFESGEELPFSEPGSFLPLGKVEKPINLCPKTSYYKVEGLYGKFGPYEYYPAPLSRVTRAGATVYPMENAVKPYSTRLRVYEQPWLQQAVHVAMRPLAYYTRGSSRRIYTFEEAVIGVPEEKFRSIPRGTAAGYPYVLEVSGGKKEFFGDGQEYDLSGPRCKELEERVEHILVQARAGVRLSHVFVDFLKDELRSKAKVEAVATRLISSAPLDYVVAWRRLFGAFSAAVMRNHTKTGMAPGICAYTDWNELARHLRKKGPKVFDGDFKAFDSSEQPTIMRHILAYINEWYDDGEENARARRVLWEDLCHSRHIGGLGTDQRYIYQWCKSLPSGHPFTTILNSIYSLVCLVGAYIVTTGDLIGFWDHVSPVTYGDDNVSNVDDETSELFNQRTVAGALDEQFGLTYTPGRKDGVWQETAELEEVTFLKRSFRMEDGVYVAPLELDSFLYTCYWGKNKRLQETITLDVLENALCELSLHDPRLWDAHAPAVRSALEERDHVTRARFDRREYARLIASRDDAWY